MDLEILSPLALLAPRKPVKSVTPKPSLERVSVDNDTSLIPPLRPPVMTLGSRREFSASVASFPKRPILPSVHETAGPFLSLQSGKTHNASFPLFPVPRPIEEMDFDKMCLDPSVTVRPRLMQFIPAAAWTAEPVSFGLLVSTFWRKRNSMHCKFPYKLYNALKLTQFCPEFIPHIGVEWVTDSVFRVNRVAFARLLGVRTIEGGLFHQQGNFPSHGFVELPFEESDRLSRECGMGPADLSQVRFMTHQSGEFVRQSTEDDLEKCRWNGR